ncbi:uncharacterized protein LOC132724622 [Ruditapes philippinarum]|uniref:uncharacterized protein LOC132724622 n=1 Tax=Ruditapes philippinarum TaxID=129788 RepID=UPI00295BD2B7|nr:uncharacterized protein LOC132724622 [Ruditapes philippinarum]
MASNGEEMEPVDKEKEIQIEFFLEAFRDYIAKTVDYRDLMFFKHFTLDQKKQFRSQAKKGADDSVVTNEMIGVILDMKDKPGRYSTLVNLFQFELENQKVSHILQGKQMPSYAGQQKEKIQRVMKVICENLDIVEILPVLLQHKLIIGRESQNLQNTAKNESNHEAALDLIVGMLSNRQIHWYSKFLLCLIEAGMEFLAEKIDKPVYDRILGYQKEKGKSLSAQEQDHLFQSCEEYGMTSLSMFALFIWHTGNKGG